MRAVLRHTLRYRHVVPGLGRGHVLRGGGRHHRRVLQVHLHPLGQRVDLRRRGRGLGRRAGLLLLGSRGPHGGEVVCRRRRGVQRQRHGGGGQAGVVMLDHVADVVDSRGRRGRRRRGRIRRVAEMSRVALMNAAVDAKMAGGSEVHCHITQRQT